jgi:hypothetical protein
MRTLSIIFFACLMSAAQDSANASPPSHNQAAFLALPDSPGHVKAAEKTLLSVASQRTWIKERRPSRVLSKKFLIASSILMASKIADATIKQEASTRPGCSADFPNGPMTRSSAYISGIGGGAFLILTGVFAREVHKHPMDILSFTGPILGTMSSVRDSAHFLSSCW